MLSAKPDGTVSDTAPTADTVLDAVDSGGGFDIPEEATWDVQAACEVLHQADYFVLDSQTHHVDMQGGAAESGLLAAYAILRSCPPPAVAPNHPECTDGVVEELSQANYLKEIFLDSETAVAMMSGVPAPSVSMQSLSNDAMGATRDLANAIGASQRCIMQGMVTPNITEADVANSGEGLGTLVSDIQRLKEELDIRALKVYPGAGGPGSFLFNNYPGWRVDDPVVSYPMIETALQHGVNVMNIHKGFRINGVFDPEFCDPSDIPQAVKDFPEMNFVVFHSAVDTPPFDNYFEEWLQIRTSQIPSAENVYTELGGAWARHVILGPDALAHFIGKLLLAFGEDRIIWGTDAIWSGSPQWQIDALKTFVMPPSFIADYGYPPVTTQTKAKILGLNAAKLYGVDPEATRCAIAADAISTARATYREGHFQPSLRTYGPRNRREFLRNALKG